MLASDTWFFYIDKCTTGEAEEFSLSAIANLGHEVGRSIKYATIGCKKMYIVHGFSIKEKR